MLEVSSGHLGESGAMGLLSGPSSGIPYRFYVLEAFQQGISLLSLLLWTPIARLERIVIAPIAVLALNFGLKKFAKRLTEQARKQLLIVVIAIYWIALYIWYWWSLLPAKYS
jgi:hypothetical protein